MALADMLFKLKKKALVSLNDVLSERKKIRGKLEPHEGKTF